VLIYTLCGKNSAVSPGFSAEVRQADFLLTPTLPQENYLFRQIVKLIVALMALAVGYDQLGASERWV
jgi:hypothetical protein